jgi:tetratricopeptide (TPR) repeat protein
MAKIALRVYNREIESLIEGGQLDEAIAHCQHILKTFPMYVETYRMLGKAHLEGRRYTDAADIFLRILQAVPDDFVAQVGMSIIRDDENNLDEAIWHMERAFEVQPSNSAIQGEMRRLYGRRDGVEPPKIRLSRDALANMYAQGELFNAAITEIRSVLAEDANRPDLQVMLARAYYRAGQKVEAAEIAIQLLKKYPNCMDALRILLDVLPGTTRADDTKVYRRHLIALDPYSAFVTGSVFQSDEVADTAVSLERLEYKPGSTPAPAKGDWAALLGVKLEDESKGDEPPEWLKNSEVSVPAHAPEPATPAESIPSWLREAGWQESTGEAKEAPLELAPEPEPARPLAPAEIPEWLQSMAPPEVTGAAVVEPVAPPAEAGDLPDWLIEMKPESNASPETGPEKPAPAPLDESVSPSPTGPSKRLSIEDDAMSWLESLAAKQGANPDELLTKPEDRPAEVPNSVMKLGEETPVTPEAASDAPDMSAPAGPTGPSQPLGIEADTLAWLQSLAVEQGAPPDELLAKPEDSPKDASDGMEKLGEKSSTPEPLPAEAEPLEGLAATQPDSGEDTISTWLKNLDETGQPVKAPPTVPAEAPSQEPDLPDWLKGLERPAPVVEPALESGDLPDWLRSPVQPAPAEESRAWSRDDAAPEIETPAPTTPEEWVPAEKAEPIPTETMPAPVPQAEVSQPKVPDAPKPLALPVPASRPIPSIPGGTGILARIPEQDRDAEILSAAQAALNGNKLDIAIQLYIKLIKKGRLLEEVIHDLREAIYLFPVDIIVWQTLGDAYMRANRLQDALDAYTKAEELLR